ncbi:type I restriction-modification system, endonuclease S subunit [Rhodopirellula europaea 6C]|uniref:Type I restriction-modification system, endonuclease S subunit n=1 Tax=Rhodopirellula europaea 6C TaxID=1263867 RepID=M2A3J0_9BACT|nr:type I restriction-modification system, endonuclease S subunit [Rhodopirellula europaea 6C]
MRFDAVVRDVKESEREPVAAGLERYIGLEHIEPENLHVSEWGDLVVDEVSFTKVFREGQVLFGKRRAYQRKVAIARFDGICSSDILTFEAKSPELHPDLLPFIVQSDGFFDHALDTSSGSLSPRTRWSQLKDYRFRLPSLAKQKWLAGVLWSADSAKLFYSKCVDQLIDLRASVFHESVGLVGDNVLSDVLNKRRTDTLTGDNVVSIESLANADRQVVQVGPFGGSLASKYFRDQGTIVLKINNITETGELDLTDAVRVDDSHAATLERYRVRSDDLITAAQATTGRTTLVSPEAENALISQHLIRVSVDRSRCEARYLLACFHSPLILHQINMVKAKTTRDGLNTDDVENFLIPLPSAARQLEIVAQLDAIDERIEVVEAHIERLDTVARVIREKELYSAESCDGGGA